MLPDVVLCPIPREEMSTRRRRRRRGKEGGAEGEELIASGAECLSRQPAPPPGDSRTQALPPLPHKRVSSLPRNPTAQSKRAKATCCPHFFNDLCGRSPATKGYGTKKSSTKRRAGVGSRGQLCSRSLELCAWFQTRDVPIRKEHHAAGSLFCTF